MTGVRRTWRPSRWVLWSVAVLGTTAGLLASGGGVAGGQVPLASFSAVGAAEGVRYSATAVGAPLSDQVADAGGPVAQSEVDSVNGSRAFTAVPYPGETVITGPAVVGGALGLPASAPGYPLIASSRHPTEPESKTSQPGIELTARSNETSSQAEATTTSSADGATGFGTAAASSTSSLDNGTGALKVTATSRSEVIVVAGLLRIGRVQGTAAASLVPGGQIERRSELVVSEVTVGGVSGRITEQGLVVGDAPAGAALPQVDPLKDSGVSARLVQPQEREDGIMSGALEVTIEQEGPSGPTRQVFTFGQASAWVSSEPGSALAEEGLGDLPSDAAGGDLGGSSIDGLTPTPVGVGAGAGAPVGAGTSAADELAAAVDLQETPASRAARLQSLADASSFYLAIVLAALVALGAGQLVRLMGVRTAWIS